MSRVLSIEDLQFDGDYLVVEALVEDAVVVSPKAYFYAGALHFNTLFQCV